MTAHIQKSRIKKLTHRAVKRTFKRGKLNRFSLTIFVIVFAGLGGYFIFSSFAASTPLNGITVSGNNLIDGRTGGSIILKGVNRSGSEYACIQGNGIFDGTGTNDDSQVPLMKSWGINEVNIPINEDCWLGINGSGVSGWVADSGQNYINAIVHETQTLEANGIVPVIALFWTANGTNKALDHAAMVDNDHGPALWQSMANTFKSDPNVILRIKEEPIPAGNSDGASAWACWKNGDVQYDTSNTLTPISTNSSCSEGYQTIGMQSMINIIRGTGAHNVIQVPGVQFANSMTNFLNPTYKVSDSLNPAQLMGVVDTYPVGNGCGTVSCYNSKYAPIAAIMPFMAGETAEDASCSSSSTADIGTFLDWLDQHNSSYSAWTWDTWGGTCQLITSYSTGAANSPWGTYYKARLSNAPTASLTANPQNLLTGNNSGSTLTWSSTNSTSCAESNNKSDPNFSSASVATSGSQLVTPSQTTIYTITCTGGGTTAQASTTVSVGSSGGASFDHNLGSKSHDYSGVTGTTSDSFNTTAAASANTRVVVTVSYWAQTTTSTVSSVTVKGSSATLDKRNVNSASDSGGHDIFEVWSIPEPSGLASGSAITVNFPSGQLGGLLYGAVSIAGVDLTNGGGVSGTASSTGSGTDWTTGSVSSINGILVGGSGDATPVGPVTATFSNGTKVHDTWMSGPAQGFTDGYNIGGVSLDGTFSSSISFATGAAVAYTGAGGSNPAPTVSLQASPTTITSGGSSTLTWSSTNATSCTASNGWSGTKATSGTQSVSPTVTTTYALSCTGAGGTTQASATVTVNAVAVTGDLNNDGHVNLADLSIFLTHWQQQGTGIPEDFDHNNIVNLFDLSQLLTNYGT